MPIDPDNPPIWLRKLHVSAAQISPSDYPASPAEGILAVCRLSDAVLAISKTFQQSRALHRRSSDHKLVHPTSEPDNVKR